MKEYWTIKNKKSGSWWCRASCFTSQKHARGTYTHRVHALEAMISIIQDCPDIEKDVTLVRVTVKTKPRGAKVGTWAWACEQMLSGSVVWKSAHQTRYYLSYDRELLEFTENVSAAKRATVTAQMMRSTSWGVVP